MLLGKPCCQPCWTFQGRSAVFSGSVVAQPVKAQTTAAIRRNNRREFISRGLDRLPQCRRVSNQESRSPLIGAPLLHEYGPSLQVGCCDVPSGHHLPASLCPCPDRQSQNSIWDPRRRLFPSSQQEAALRNLSQESIESCCSAPRLACSRSPSQAPKQQSRPGVFSDRPSS